MTPAALLRRVAPPHAQPQLPGLEGPHAVALGYEGRTLAEFLDLLLLHGVQRVVDVRDNPWSRKGGFSALELEEALALRGLAYTHLKALGCPADIRHAHRHGKSVNSRPVDFHAAYREHLDRQGEALARLEALARKERVAVMCMESDIRHCHRRELADWLEGRGLRVLRV